MENDGVDVKLARIEVHLAQLTEQIGRMTTLLLGVDGKPGMVVRVDRLEQGEARRSKFVWLALGAALTALAKAVTL